MKQSVIVSIVFSGLFLIILSLNILTPYFNENEIVSDFFYPRSSSEIKYELFIFLLLLLSAVGMLYEQNILAFIYPIPIMFIFYVGLVFVFIGGSYGNYSEWQTKVIGYIFLAYSILSFILALREYPAKKNSIRFYKLKMRYGQLFCSIILFNYFVCYLDSCGSLSYSLTVEICLCDRCSIYV